MPELYSVYFPDTDPANGTTPISAEAEIVVSIAPPAPGTCPTEVTIGNVGLFYVHGYTPPNKPTVWLGEDRLRYANLEQTFVVSDLPSLAASILTDSPSIAVANQPLVYTLTVRNASPPGTIVPLDDAEDVVVRVNIPKVPANGVITPLLVDSVTAPGGTIAYGLPEFVTITYAAALPPDATRTITLSTRVPPGVIDGTSFTIGARLDWRDDFCGPASATLAESTGFFGLPALEVVKTADFAFGMTGTELVYTLDYVNAAQSPSTRSWIVDRIAPGSRLVRAAVPQPNGQVWFSTALPPTLPAALSPTDPFTDQRVAQHFARALDGDGDGWVVPPANATYVAFLVDDGALTPPQFVTGQRRTVRFESVIETTQLGSIVANQAAILSKELIQAISNKTNFTVTSRPGLRITKSCAAVVATNEQFTYVVDYYNDSANQDDNATLVETLPDGLSLVDVAHEWNDAYGGNANPVISVDGQDITVRVPALAPREGGRLFVTVVAENGIPSGTFLLPETLGTAYSGTETRSGYAACTVLIENADLFVRKLVDNPAPRSGEAFQYTLVFSNEGAHEAIDVAIRDALPNNLEYIPGSVVVTPFPWKLSPDTNPVRVGNELVWTEALGNGLVNDDSNATLPGRSGNVSIIFGARVKTGVLPGTTIRNCASISTSTGEDANFANQGCVEITTPLPDPYITKVAPPLKKPGEKVTWTITYGNGSNEVAGGVVIIDRLPDNPLPNGDNKVDVTFSGVVAPPGVAVWYYMCPIATGCTAVPTFNPQSTAPWTQNPTPPVGQAVSYVAFFVGDLPPLAPSRSVQLSATLRTPSGALSGAGALFEPCATIGMTSSGYRDQDLTNNQACAPTRIPGIDLQALKTAEPSGRYPGVEPGDTVTFYIGVVNSGTVPAFGITLTDLLPPEVELVAPPQSFVELTDASGQAVAPVNSGGVRMQQQVPWTRVNNTFYMGLDDTSALGYRNVGLLAGDRAVIALVTRVKDGVANQTIVNNTVTVATTGVEDIKGNNSASVEVAVYRADPFIIKTVASSSAVDPGTVDVGDIVEWRLEYGNAGDFVAEDVIIEDAIPGGLDFVVGSLGGLDPETMEPRYSNDGGATWGYLPQGASGAADPAVTHVRVVWTSALPAPASGIFVQTSAGDFEPGTHQGTRPDATLDAVVSTGEPKCEFVTCDEVRCPNGGYVPAGECCEVCRPAIDDACEKAPLELGCRGGWDGCYPRGSCTGQCAVGSDAAQLVFVAGGDNGVRAYDISAKSSIDAEPAFVLRPGDGSMYGVLYAAPRDMLVVTDYDSDVVYFYDGTSSMGADSTPSRSISGPSTGFENAEDVAYDPVRDLLYVGGYHGIAIFPEASSIDGDVAPRTIVDTIEFPARDQRFALNVEDDILYVADPELQAIYRFNDASSLADDSLADEVFDVPSGFIWGLALDRERDILYYADQATHEDETGVAAPLNAISQISTKVSGQVLADRRIQGANTMLVGPSDVVIDVANDVLWVADADGDQVLVFERASTIAGDVAPAWTIDAYANVLSYPGDLAIKGTRGDTFEDTSWSLTRTACAAFQERNVGAWLECVSGGLAAGGYDAPSCDHYRCEEVDEEGYCVGEPVDAWSTCWPQECPSYRAYDCEAEQYWEQCNAAYGQQLALYMRCVDALIWEGDVAECDWLAPEDTCGRCDVATCTSTPDELKSWGQVRFWRDDLVQVPLFELYLMFSKAELPFPTGILPVDNVRACAPGLGCAQAADTGGCAVPCNQDCNPAYELCEIQLCVVCSNGAICQVCEGGLSEYEGRETRLDVIDVAQPTTTDCGTVAAKMAERYALCLDFTHFDEELCASQRPPSCEEPLACQGGIYTSPAFPGPDDGTLLAWDRAVVSQSEFTGSDSRQLTYSVVDAATGEPLPGLDGLPRPAGGAIDLSGVDPAAHPSLQLQARFVGADLGQFTLHRGGFPYSGECGDVYWPEVYFEPLAIGASGLVVGGAGDCDNDKPFVWRREWPDPILIYQGTRDTYAYDVNDRDEVVGHGWIYGTEFDTHFSFYWSEDTGFIDIAESLGHVWNEKQIISLVIEDINNQGIAAGWMTVGDAGDAASPTTWQLFPVTWSYLGGLQVLEQEGGFSGWGCAAYPVFGKNSTRITDNGWFGGMFPVGSSGCSIDTRLVRWNTNDGTYTTSTKEMDPPNQFFGIDTTGRMGFDWALFWNPDGSVTSLFDAPPPTQNDERITDPYFYRLEEDGSAVGGCNVYRADPDSGGELLIGISAACLLEPEGLLVALPTGRHFRNSQTDWAEAFARNRSGDVLVLHYYYGGDGRYVRFGELALWDGERYLYVDGYDPAVIKQTWSSWYVWDSLAVSPLNDARQLTGHAIGDTNGKEFGIDRPYIWSPATDVMALLDWRVLFETDRNPSVTLRTEVAGACADDITNTGTISTSSPEVTTANNASSAAVKMNRADVRVVVRPEPSVVGPADESYQPPITWHVRVINDGPGIARGVSVDVDLPGYGTDTFDGIEIAPGESWSGAFEGYSSEFNANASIVGAVEVSTASLDCNTANNAGTGTVFVGSWPNIYVTVDGPPSAIAGDTFVYTIDWGNSGNDDANATEIALAIPPGFTLEDVASDACTLDGATLVCGTVPAGYGETLTLTLSTAGCGAISADAYSLQAVATTTSVEVDVSDNLGGDSTRILAPPGTLSLALAQSRGTVAADDTVTWTVYFANTGLGGILGPTFTAPIPAGWSYVDGTASGGGQLVTGDGGSYLQWQGDVLAPGDGGALQFTARVEGSGDDVELWTVYGGGEGACPSQVQGGVSATQQAGLTLVKSVDRAAICGQPSRVDSPLEWSITVSNPGPNARTDVVVSDLVPAGMAYVAGTISGRGADASDAARPTWHIGRLGPGEALTVGYRTKVVAPVPGIGGIASGGHASATSLQGEATSGDTLLRLDCEPGLVITKVWTAGCALPGSNRGLELRVRNDGRTPVGGVVVSDVLPASLLFQSASQGGVSGGVFVAELGTLGVAQEKVVTLALRTASNARSGTVFTNAATLAANNLPPQVSNQVVGAVLACDDGNVCTANTCEPALGCVYPDERDGSSCSDGNACTRVDACASGECVGSDPVVCVTAGQCYGVGTCDPTTGVCDNPALATGQPCNDGNACTREESCLAGECGRGANLSCDDGNPCTVDSCDPATGCVHTAATNGTTCDDQDVCSTSSECRAGECVATFYRSCNDANPCTVDGCDPKTGCDFDTFVAEQTPCDDGNACTDETTCRSGVCRAGTAVVCDDDNTCTHDGCDPSSGCVFADANGIGCDDGIACTTRSVCDEGRCQGVAFLTCDDGNACTSDRCDPVLGCVFEDVAAGASCSDGKTCTTGDACDGQGACVGAPVVCGEPGECELAGACNEATGACDFPVKPGDTAIPVRLADLGSAGVDSAAVAIAGEYVAGWVAGSGGARQVALWGPAGLSELGAGEATGVNASGQVVAVRGDAVVFIDDGVTSTLWTRGVVDGEAGPVFGPNEGGAVAGQGAAGPAMRLPSGTVVTLAAPDATHVDLVRAFGGGWVVGTEEGTTNAIDVRAFRWNGIGARQLLALPSGATASMAHAVGAAGHIGGEVTTAAGEQAVVWRPDGAVAVLPPACLGAACLEDSAVIAVDGAGRFLGRGRLADGSERAFYGELGGESVVLEPTGAVATYPVAMSDTLVAGTWQTAAGALLGFVFSEDLGLVELAAPGASAVPTHVSGEWVLGTSTAANGARRAFLWSATRGMEDLGSLGGGSSVGHALADDGRVAGGSRTLDGGSHAFVSGEPVFGCVACAEDREPPTLVCPVVGKPLECAGGGASVALGRPSARDLCTFPVVVGGDVPESFPLGTSEVVFTASDALGNEASCSVSVTVVDTTAPSVTCPEPRTVEQPAGACGVAVALEAVVDDACDPTGVRVISDAPASFAVGATSVTFTAVDAAGNSASCSTTVTVIDATPLAIVCDPSLTVEAPADFCGWPEAITATVTDECAADVIVQSEADAFPIGLSTVTFRADNDAGESASCTTELTVLDVIPPALACNTVERLAPAELPRAFGASASDVCTATLEVSGLECVRGGEAFSEGCDARVEAGVVVIARADPGADSAGDVSVRWTVKATDPSGNVASVECAVAIDRDLDRDDDGVLDADDNCVDDANPDQLDYDGDGEGNACDAIDDALLAQGDGGCAGGGAGGLGLLLGALALAWRARRGLGRHGC